MTERNEDAAKLAAEKRELRVQMRALRSSLHSAVPQRSLVASQRMLDLAFPHGTGVVALYMGLLAEGELDASVLDRPLRERGFSTVYPRVLSKRPPTLAFSTVDDLASLRASAFGVREPDITRPVVPLSAIDVFVVPGIAFDGEGGRLGYGGGYYDSTLVQCPRALRVGYCHTEQVVARVPCGGYDQHMDVLVTPDSTMSWTSRRGTSLSGEPQ